MRQLSVRPSGVERTFSNDEVIVSKTDVQGRLTYANDVFVRVSAYPEDELIGKPHNVIRHPDMPSAVFKLLWDTIQAGDEIFAYVLNLAGDGAHYWVLAHVTPTFSPRVRSSGSTPTGARPTARRSPRSSPCTSGCWPRSAATPVPRTRWRRRRRCSTRS